MSINNFHSAVVYSDLSDHFLVVVKIDLQVKLYDSEQKYITKRVISPLLQLRLLMSSFLKLIGMIL